MTLKPFKNQSIITICCECDKIKMIDRYGNIVWAGRMISHNEGVSHEYCPVDAKTAMVTRRIYPANSPDNPANKVTTYHSSPEPKTVFTYKSWETHVK